KARILASSPNVRTSDRMPSDVVVPHSNHAADTAPPALMIPFSTAEVDSTELASFVVIVAVTVSENAIIVIIKKTGAKKTVNLKRPVSFKDPPEMSRAEHGNPHANRKVNKLRAQAQEDGGRATALRQPK